MREVVDFRPFNFTSTIRLEPLEATLTTIAVDGEPREIGRKEGMSKCGTAKQASSNPLHRVTAE
jgi:hypothetical protein